MAGIAELHRYPNSEARCRSMRRRMAEAPLTPDILGFVDMPDCPSGRMDKNTDRLLLGDSHPVLAIVAFVATFLFAALPFLFDTDRVFIVVPCIIGCFSCCLLFLRLLVGAQELKHVKYICLGIAAYLFYLAGRQWYLIVLITGGTVLCSILIARLIGPFVPVTHQRKR
jgi:hypothetical protein